MRVLVTGADGFVGQALAQRLADNWPDLTHLVLCDRGFQAKGPAGAECREGDLADPAFRDSLFDPAPDLVFHLASVPGSLAERKAETGYAINLKASLALARLAAARRPGTRFVFASSIAVYGDLGTEPVTAATRPQPVLSYGAHKLMTEIQLTDQTRRGDLSAISLRLPGIVARPAAETGHGSAFMSQIFHHISQNRSYNCPVPGESSCWWMSRSAAVGNLIHAAGFDTLPGTVVQIPVLQATVAEVARAISRVCGHAPDIRWGDDSHLQRLFGAMPSLDATPAHSSGFWCDRDPISLAKAILATGVSS